MSQEAQDYVSGLSARAEVAVDVRGLWPVMAQAILGREAGSW
jgi:hypothetical protein